MDLRRKIARDELRQHRERWASVVLRSKIMEMVLDYNGGKIRFGWFNTLHCPCS